MHASTSLALGMVRLDGMVWTVWYDMVFQCFHNPALNSSNYSAQGLHQLQAATLFGISLILATTLFPQSRPQHPASMIVVTLLAPLLLSPQTPETQAPVGARPLPFWCQKTAARYVLPILVLLTLHFSLQQYIVVFSCYYTFRCFCTLERVQLDAHCRLLFSFTIVALIPSMLS